MNRQTLNLALLAVLFGLAVGVLAPRLQKGEWRTWFSREEQPITLPEGELVTDAFSLKLLQTALQQAEPHTTLVCPAAMTLALQTIAAWSEGETREQVERLKLSAEYVGIKSVIFMAAIEDSLLRKDSEQELMALPFRSDYPKAVTMFNTLFGHAAANFTNTSRDTRLFAALRTELFCRFLQPFYASDAKAGDFDNENGGMPSVRLMRRCGRFRVAEADDGAWKAVALMLRGGRPSSAFVAVLPRGKVGEFARGLDAAQMSAIRRALAEATPQEITVELPRLNIAVNTDNNAPLIQALGVTAPFDIRTADFSEITAEHIALNAISESCLCILPEEEEKPEDVPHPDSCPQAFSLTRPFLWFVGDLTSPDPLVALGIVENL